jgi:hypothetical protein
MRLGYKTVCKIGSKRLWRWRISRIIDLLDIILLCKMFSSKEAVSTITVIWRESYERMIALIQMETIGEETVKCYLILPYCHSHGCAEKNHKISQTRYSVRRSRFEPGPSRIELRRLTAWVNLVELHLHVLNHSCIWMFFSGANCTEEVIRWIF